MAGDFETALRHIESEIAAAEAKVKRGLTRLARARRSAAGGDVLKMQSELEAAPRELEAAIPVARALAAQFEFDLSQAMQDGRYVAELGTQAAANGLVLIERDSRLSAFPSLLKLEPRAQAVRVGRRLVRDVRPSVLVKRLLKAQQQSKPNPQGFLELVWRVYRPLAQSWKRETEAAGPIISLLRLHEMMTVLPAAAADYPREAFACDLLHLNRAPDARTRDGYGYSLHASTSARGAERVTVFDERGGEHIFAGIRFYALPAETDSADGNRG